MEPRLFYLVIALVMIGDAVAMFVVQQLRAKLDLTTEAGRKRDQGLKIAMMVIPLQAAAAIGVLWVIFQPPLILPG